MGSEAGGVCAVAARRPSASVVRRIEVSAGVLKGGVGELEVEAFVDAHGGRFRDDGTGRKIASAMEYFRATRAAGADPPVAARGRDAGTAWGADPAGGVAEIAARVLPLVDAQEGTELVTTICGRHVAPGLPADAVFELAVRTADLATALGVAPDVPATAATQALDVVAELTFADGLAGPLPRSQPLVAGPPGGLLGALTLHRRRATRLLHFRRRLRSPCSDEPDPRSRRRPTAASRRAYNGPRHATVLAPGSGVTSNVTSTECPQNT